MYKRTSYHVCHHCVTVRCNTISNINETKRAYCSSLHMYIYIYILYRHWKYTRVCSCQQQFCNKDETSLACASIFCTRIIAELLLLEFPPIFRYFIGEKKKEREIKKECYNEECWTMKKSRVKFSLFIDFNSGKCVKISMIFQEEKKKRKTPSIERDRKTKIVRSMARLRYTHYIYFEQASLLKNYA